MARSEDRKQRRRSPWRRLTPGQLTTLITALSGLLTAVGYVLFALKM
ncbi:MAG: hypothetical protein HOV79_00425 [Hamadaea sp.]|nr:hypothetical protein [Hamadaea sp.]